MRNNPFEDVPSDDTPASVVYEGVEYGVNEAEALARWLGDDAPMALFNRYLDSIRQISVDMMDGGLVTMSEAEELVRHAAIRQLILGIKTMGAGISAQLEAIAQAKTDVE